MKYFWLIRHAKSQSTLPRPGMDDFDRDLNKRGRGDGEQMRDWFAQIATGQPEWRPDWLVTSSAVRAEATSRFVANGFALTSDQQTSDAGLYHAGPETLLDALRCAPPDTNCVALVAHNPGLTWLLNALSDPAEAIDNLPTFGSALFRTEVTNWVDLAQGAQLTQRLALMTPKTLG